MDPENRKRPFIVSFSGIDGAGKSTQIESLVSWLESADLRVTVLSMWDDIVACRVLRESASRYAFGGDQGIGTPERPLSRCDKNLQSRPLDFFRYCFYFADAISLRLRLYGLRRLQQQDVVIFDRYIYDELANLQLKRRLARKYAGLVLRVAPPPDIAYIIDVDPAAAHARKPEYPLDFVRTNRESFLSLRTMVKDAILIATPSLSAAREKIQQTFLSRMAISELNSPLPAMRG